MSAQWTLSIIKEIPSQPKSLPTCISNILSTLELGGQNYSYNEANYTSYNNYNTCDLVSIKPKYDFTETYNSLLSIANKINSYGTEISTLRNERSRSSYEQDRAQNDYNTALTEKIANEEDGIYSTNENKEKIQNSRSTINQIDSQIGSLTNKIESLRSNNENKTQALKQEYEKAQDGYRTAYLLYKFYVAILSLLFAVIVFSILYKIYIKQKIDNSPHAIIFSVATFAYGLVLLEIVWLFLWDIIPHKIFELLMSILTVFTPLLYLVQFLWPVLIIVVFGFLVFRIQKRLYSPQNVLKRFIADKKCPNCGNGVDFTKPYCPLCSHEIQIDCPHCHILTLKWMPYCSNCGWKLLEWEWLTHTHLQSFDAKLDQELKNVDISEYGSVIFSDSTGGKFIMKRANVIKVAKYLIIKLWKTTFAWNELTPYIQGIMEHLHQASISKAELDRIMGRINSWVESGGTIELKQK